jgi:hypothetical protein
MSVKIVHEYKVRDKYGRTVTHVEAVHEGVAKRHTVVVVTMPKTVTDPAKRYLVNDWGVQYVGGRTDEQNGITYLAKRADALALARTLASKEI